MAQQLLLKEETPGFEYHTHTLEEWPLHTKASATADAQERSAPVSNPEWQASAAEEESSGDEFHEQQSTQQLKGVKFHLYETYETADGIDKENGDSIKNIRMWVYCAVYDSSVMSLKTVKAFMGKTIEQTELQRMRYTTDGCHEIFRPALLREMQAMSFMSKQEVRKHLDTIQDKIRANVEILLAATPSEDDSRHEARYHQMIRTAQYGAMPLHLRSEGV